MTPLMKFLRANVLELSYLTEKRTLIRDWRLALLYYALLGLVTAYVVTSLVNGKSYIMTEVPTGVASAWGSGGEEFYNLQKEWSEGNQCTEDGRKKYMFNYSASYVYNNVNCGYFNAAEMISKLPSGNVMFFATHAHQSLVARYKATTTDGGLTYTCPEAAMESNFGEAAQQVVDGRCTHLKENNYIIPGMEGSTMAFDHSYDTTSGDYSGTKPKTYVQKKDSDVNEYEFAPGQSVQLTMKQWLELAAWIWTNRLTNNPEILKGRWKG